MCCSAAASGSTPSPTSGCSPWWAAASIMRRPSRPRSRYASSAASRPRPTHPRPRTRPGRRGRPQNGAVGGQQRNRDERRDPGRAARGGLARRSDGRRVGGPHRARPSRHPRPSSAGSASVGGRNHRGSSRPRRQLCGLRDWAKSTSMPRTACARSRRPFDHDGRSVKSRAEPKARSLTAPRSGMDSTARARARFTRGSQDPGSRSSRRPCSASSLGVVAVAAMPTRPPGRPAPQQEAPGRSRRRSGSTKLGFTPEETKTAYLLTASRGPSSFAVVDDAGRTVLSGRAKASRGRWNRGYRAVRPLDLTALRALGTYRIRVAGITSAPFRVAPSAELFGPLIGDAVAFFSAQRDGANIIPGPLHRRPAHLRDRHARVYHWPRYESPGSDVIVGRSLRPIGGHIDLEGGWVDAGNFIKFTHTTAYAETLLLAARRALGDNARASLAPETRFGLHWLGKAWDQRRGVMLHPGGHRVRQQVRNLPRRSRSVAPPATRRHVDRRPEPLPAQSTCVSRKPTRQAGAAEPRRTRCGRLRARSSARCGREPAAGQGRARPRSRGLRRRQDIACSAPRRRHGASARLLSGVVVAR